MVKQKMEMTLRINVIFQKETWSCWYDENAIVFVPMLKSLAQILADPSRRISNKSLSYILSRPNKASFPECLSIWYSSNFNKTWMQVKRLNTRTVLYICLFSTTLLLTRSCNVHREKYSAWYILYGLKWKRSKRIENGTWR